MKNLIAILLLFFIFCFCGFFIIKGTNNFFVLSASAKTAPLAKSPYKNYSIIIGVDEILGKYQTLHYEFND